MNVGRCLQGVRRDVLQGVPENVQWYQEFKEATISPQFGLS